MKKQKIIIGATLLAILAVVFWWGGNSPELRGWTVSTYTPSEITVQSETRADATLPTESAENAGTEESKSTEKPKSPTSEPAKKTVQPIEEKNTPKSEKGKLTADEKIKLAEEIVGAPPDAVTENADNSKENDVKSATQEDKYSSNPATEGKPTPLEPKNKVVSDNELRCTLSITCDNVLKNISWLVPQKVDIVPKDGIILKEQTVLFYEGESVFDVLLRETKKNKIHFEFVSTPIYNSEYIEGINNIYEFDCGELSGWMYKVNDRFPNYGCSRYKVEQGDKIEWVYTCNLGADVGGYTK